jgi:enterochelin esterase-like enzyme
LWLHFVVVNSLPRWRKVLLAGMIALVAAAGAPLLIIRVGEWYRDWQEAVIFARRLHGQLRHVTYESRLLRRTQRFIIYLPPSYGSSSRQRYPVVYLLQGCPGQPRDWLVKGRVHDTIEHLLLSRRAPEMILVMAEGSGPGGRFDCTLYMNRIDGAYPAESSLINELVPLVDQRFRTIARREGRALLGVSSGGFAALNLGVRHPDRFAVLASHSGFFRAADDPREVRRVLDNDARAWQANSPADRIAAVPHSLAPHVFLNDGTADPELTVNKQFARQLQELGIDHTLRVTRGRHGWTYWRRNLPYSLMWVGSRLESGAVE